MSVAINRQEINEFLYYGKATIMNYTVLPTSKYSEERFAKAYTQFDLNQAKKWLDEMGLIDRDGDGWRDRKDGKKFTFAVEFTTQEDPLKLNTVELVAGYWKKAGIDVNTKEISGELSGTRQAANLIECGIWHGGWETGILFPFSNPLMSGNGSFAWPKIWQHYFAGKEIDQPIPPEVQDLYNAWMTATTTSDKNELLALGKKMLQLQADNMWLIGTVGLAPSPIIVRKNLRNMPETGHYTWEVQWLISRNPEQMFFE